VDRDQPRAPAEGLPESRGPAWERLEDQLSWYERRSASSKRTFVSLKVVQLVGAAGVPVAASVHAAVWLTGGLGAAVVVLEGIQQLGQFQANWISYRGAAEGLAREKHLYLAGAGPYAAEPDPPRLLAERVEGVVSADHTGWTAGREDASRRGDAGALTVMGSTEMRRS
jgi:hypothetical protein